MDSVNVSLNNNRDEELSEDATEDLNDKDKETVDDVSKSIQELQIDQSKSNPSPLKTNLNVHLSPNNSNLNCPPFNETDRTECVSRLEKIESGGHGMDVRKTQPSFIDILEKLKEVQELSIPTHIYEQLDEQFSRKVFVGGLPPDIYELQIEQTFNCFGPLAIDWPHKFESGSYFPPKGFAFLLFQSEDSVKKLIRSCSLKANKLYWLISSKTIKYKEVEIRPWRIVDADFVVDSRVPLDLRRTVFVGGVPRPTKAFELASTMENLYGGVCYASIDTDTEYKYPKGSGRITFNNKKSLIAAISDRFIQLQQGDLCKQVEVKPYVRFDQMCDGCNGRKCYGRFASFFCANIMCLKYLCESCWSIFHSQSGRGFHKPFIKDFTSRPLFQRVL